MKIGTNWTKGNAQTHSLSPSPSPHAKGLARERLDLVETPTRPEVVHAPVLAESPTHRRILETRTIEGNSFPMHPPGFPIPPPSTTDSYETYQPRLGSSRQPIPRPSARTLKPESHPQASVPRHLLCLAGNYVLVTYPNSPLLHVHDSRPVKSDTVDVTASQQGPLIAELSHSSRTGEMNQPVALIPPPPGWSSPSRPDLITAIAVDDPDHQDIRIALFYRSGGFVVLTLDSHPNGDDKIWNRTIVHIPPVSYQNRKRHFIPPPSERVVLAGLKDEVLVGVTGRFYISIYRLKGAGAGLSKVLHSDVASWPASLTIDEREGEDGKPADDLDESDGQAEHDRILRVKLGYCSPIYPKSWKPSIQAIDITLPRSTNRHSPDFRIDLPDPIELARSRVGSRSLMIGVKSIPLVGARVISMSNRWVVLAGRDNLVEVYSIRESGWLEHEQTLLGHAAGVRSVALKDDKCVTSGNDGRVLVWRLDRGASLRPPDRGPDDDEGLGEGGVIEVRTLRKSHTVEPDMKDEPAGVFRQTILPVPPVTHPMSLVSAARELVSAPPEGAQKVRDLAFNEDTIVGLLADLEGDTIEDKEGVVKVWKFDA